MTTETTAWVSTQEMARELGVSVRTLTHYRDKGGFLTEGRHYRRRTPASQSPWVWHSELTSKAWAAEAGQ